jgi:hypothetical protein
MSTNASYVSQVRVAVNAMLDARSALKALMEQDGAATFAAANAGTGTGIVAGLQPADFTAVVQVPAPPLYTRPGGQLLANPDLSPADIAAVATALATLEAAFTDPKTGLPTTAAAALTKLRY